jgi:hypothetical protein
MSHKQIINLFKDESNNSPLKKNEVKNACLYNEFIWVNPRDIVYSNRKPEQEINRCMILSDDNFPKSYQRFDENPTYHYVIDRMKTGNWCVAKKDKLLEFKKKSKSLFKTWLHHYFLILRYKELDKLIDSLMKTKTLKTNFELNRKRTKFEKWLGLNNDEMFVDIGKNGEIFFTKNGTHRLALAKYLKIKKIQVKISRIHSNFIDN